MQVLTLNQWREKAVKLYGPKLDDWQFICPACKHIQTLKDFKTNNVPEPTDKFYFSCIGRFVKDRGCDWTLGGLLRIHETEVTSDEGKNIPVFEFAHTSPQSPTSPKTN